MDGLTEQLAALNVCTLTTRIWLGTAVNLLEESVGDINVIGAHTFWIQCTGDAEAAIAAATASLPHIVVETIEIANEIYATSLPIRGVYRSQKFMDGKVTAILFKSGTLVVAAKRGCSIHDAIAVADVVTNELVRRPR